MWQMKQFITAENIKLNAIIDIDITYCQEK